MPSSEDRKLDIASKVIEATADDNVQLIIKDSKTNKILSGCSFVKLLTNRAILGKTYNGKALIYQPVPNFYPDLNKTSLSLGERYIFHAMAMMMDYDGTFSTSIRKLADEIGIAKSHLQKALKKILEAHCFLGKVSATKKETVFVVSPVYASKGGTDNTIDHINNWNNYLKKLYIECNVPFNRVNQ